MKTHIYKVLFFIIVILFVDFIAGIILDKLSSNPKSGIAFQENYIFNESKEEILIFGSSRAAFHYVPTIISKETQLSVYNVGREGTGIYFCYAALLGTLERYKPKVVVLDLDFRDFYLRGGNFGPDVFKELLPYYGKINHEFDSLITPNYYDVLFCQSNLYKYNKKFFNVISGSLEKEKNNMSGYRPLKGKWDGVANKLESDDFKKSIELIQTTNAFIKKAHEYGVVVVITLSPSFKEVPSEFFEYINTLPSTYNIKVLNHFRNPLILNHQEYFKDEEHLNEKGAEEFSKILGNELKNILKMNDTNPKN
jgi:hypothetical protein